MLQVLHGNLRSRQRGQAMVLVVVFIVVVLVGFLVLFNTGQLTRQKMEVQNAADAAAYSAALLYARQLNFMAYTHRAMVANEAAIGQLSAFAAWGLKYKLGHTENTPSLRLLRSSLSAIPIIGSALATAVLAFITSVPKAFNPPTALIGRAMSILGRGLTRINGMLNQLYGAFNWVMRGTTLAAQVQSVPQIISANAKGAQLSNFGALALALSMAEQHRSFLYKADPGGDDDSDKKGKKRFVALVNDARDDWTRVRRREDLIASWFEKFGASFDFGDPFGRITLFEITFDIDIGWPNDGGTGMRLIGDDEDPGWSSVDTISFGLDGSIDVAILGSDFFWNLLGLPKPSLPLDALQVSEGGAAHERVAKGNSILGRANYPDWKEAEYGVDKNGAGGVNWDLPPIPLNPAFDAITLGYQPLSRDHAGLPTFHDIDPNNYGGADKAPVFLIGVRKNLADIKTSDNFPNAPTERFQLVTQGGGLINNAYEGNMSSIVEDHFRRFLTDFINDNVRIPSQPIRIPGIPNIDDFVNALINRFINQVTGQITKVADVILNPIQNLIGSNQPAVFSLAAARVYYKNPQDDSELGSTFNPYWEVTLQPVDDNVRKWSIVSQDPEFRAALAYLTFADFDDARKESSGLDGYQGNLDMFIGEAGNR